MRSFRCASVILGAESVFIHLRYGGVRQEQIPDEHNRRYRRQHVDHDQGR